MYYRDALGTITDWHNVSLDQGFSNFLHVADNFQSNYVVLRHLSLARKRGYRSLLVEDLDSASSQVWQQDDHALAVRCKTFTHSTAQRLTLLRCAPDAVVSPNDMVGYAILKWEHFSDEEDPKLHVYESVIQPPRTREENNFIDTARTYVAKTAIGELPVSGVIYCQQNDLTYVCAHVALRTALACVVDEADVTYFDINKIAGIDHVSRPVGKGDGLTPDMIERVLEHYGLQWQKIVNEPNRQDIPEPVIDFQRDLYGIIESKKPALLAFELMQRAGQPLGRHIIPVLGHTFNEDAWGPSAKRHYFGDQLSYYSSELWMSSYVIHDDNFGPYYCLPRHYLTNWSFRLMLGIKPKTQSKANAVDIETLAAEYASALAVYFQNRQSRWLNRFSIIAKQGYLVLRTFHTSKENYRAHLESLITTQGVTLDRENLKQFLEPLPESFWMVELSVPELFTASRRKFGELLISDECEVPMPVDFSLLLGARLPSLFSRLRENNTMEVLESAFDQHSELKTG